MATTKASAIVPADVSKLKTMGFWRKREESKGARSAGSTTWGSGALRVCVNQNHWPRSRSATSSIPSSKKVGNGRCSTGLEG